MIKETAPPYIKEHYSDSRITFACDSENAGYYTLLGGRGSSPYTVIINDKGVITEIFYKSIDYADLKEAVEKSY